jgi:NADH:ubiquinone oxidoreductase subunit 3 (subunit A)
LDQTGLIYVLGFGFAATTFVFGTILFSWLITHRRRRPQKGLPYESGVDTIGDTWSRFGLAFYLYALLFVAFDVEIIDYASDNQIDLIIKKHGLISFSIHPDYMIDARALTVYRSLLAHLYKLRSDKRLWFARPGEVNYATGGRGDGSHLAALFFNKLAGITPIAVPFQGEGPALPAVLGNQVPYMFLSAPTAADSVAVVMPNRITARTTKVSTPSGTTEATSSLRISSCSPSIRQK